MRKGHLKLVSLSLVNEEPTHGYRLMKEVERKTLGLISPTSATLYPMLREMERDGLVKGDQEGRRRVYKITEHGKRVLEKALEKHFELVEAIRNSVLDLVLRSNEMEKLKFPSFLPALKIVPSSETKPLERLETLKKFRTEIRRRIKALNIALQHVDNRIKAMKAEA